SSNCLRMSALRSTSKALHVPRPITGSFSPEEGMVRVSIADDSVFVSALTGKNQSGRCAADYFYNFASSHSVHLSICHVERSRDISNFEWITARDSSTSLGLTRRLLILWIAVVS